jgi:hypothetical protein
MFGAAASGRLCKVYTLETPYFRMVFGSRKATKVRSSGAPPRFCGVVCRRSSGGRPGSGRIQVQGVLRKGQGVAEAAPLRSGSYQEETVLIT